MNAAAAPLKGYVSSSDNVRNTGYKQAYMTKVLRAHGFVPPFATAAAKETRMKSINLHFQIINSTNHFVLPAASHFLALLNRRLRVGFVQLGYRDQHPL